MPYSSYECLIVERHGRVGWLINNRPKQLNAMNALMRDEFAQAWIELDQDPQVRVIVHTGQGTGVPDRRGCDRDCRRRGRHGAV